MLVWWKRNQLIKLVWPGRPPGITSIIQQPMPPEYCCNLVESVKSNVRIFKQTIWYDNLKKKLHNFYSFALNPFSRRWFPDSPVSSSSSNGISLFSQQPPSWHFLLPSSDEEDLWKPISMIYLWKPISMKYLRKPIPMKYLGNIWETVAFVPEQLHVIRNCGRQPIFIITIFHQTSRLYCILQRPTLLKLRFISYPIVRSSIFGIRWNLKSTFYSIHYDDHIKEYPLIWQLEGSIFSEPRVCST